VPWIIATCEERKFHKSLFVQQPELWGQSVVHSLALEQIQYIARSHDPLEEVQVLLYRSCMKGGDVVWCCIRGKARPVSCNTMLVALCVCQPACCFFAGAGGGGAFAKLRKATVRFVTSVRPRRTTGLSLDGFS
jgi:hypothetical protein